MSFEEEVNEVEKYFNLTKVNVFTEGGCRFLHLPQFYKNEKGELWDCLFGCDKFLGYENRLWFPEMFSTSNPKTNWNGKNQYINGSRWFAFSLKGKGNSILELLLSHLMEAK